MWSVYGKGPEEDCVSTITIEDVLNSAPISSFWKS